MKKTLFKRGLTIALSTIMLTGSVLSVHALELPEKDESLKTQLTEDVQKDLETAQKAADEAEDAAKAAEKAAQEVLDAVQNAENAAQEAQDIVGEGSQQDQPATGVFDNVEKAEELLKDGNQNTAANETDITKAAADSEKEAEDARGEVEILTQETETLAQEAQAAADRAAAAQTVTEAQTAAAEAQAAANAANLKAQEAQKIVDDANAKLLEAQKAYDDAVANAQKQIDDTQNSIDAEVDVVEGTELTDEEKALAEAQAAYEAAMLELDSAAQNASSAQEAAKTAAQAVEDMHVNPAKDELAGAKADSEAKKQALEEAKKAQEERLAEAAKEKAEAEANAQAEYNKKIAECDKEIADLEKELKELKDKPYYIGKYAAILAKETELSLAKTTKAHQERDWVVGTAAYNLKENKKNIENTWENVNKEQEEKVNNATADYQKAATEEAKRQQQLQSAESTRDGILDLIKNAGDDEAQNQVMSQAQNDVDAESSKYNDIAYDIELYKIADEARSSSNPFEALWGNKTWHDAESLRLAIEKKYKEDSLWGDLFYWLPGTNAIMKNLKGCLDVQTESLRLAEEKKATLDAYVASEEALAAKEAADAAKKSAEGATAKMQAANDALEAAKKALEDAKDRINNMKLNGLDTSAAIKLLADAKAELVIAEQKAQDAKDNADKAQDEADRAQDALVTIIEREAGIVIPTPGTTPGTSTTPSAAPAVAVTLLEEEPEAEMPAATPMAVFGGEVIDIEEEETPLAPEVPVQEPETEETVDDTEDEGIVIADEETPLAVTIGGKCIIHWILGILMAAFVVYEVIRRLTRKEKGVKKYDFAVVGVFLAAIVITLAFGACNIDIFVAILAAVIAVGSVASNYVSYKKKNAQVAEN